MLTPDIESQILNERYRHGEGGGWRFRMTDLSILEQYTELTYILNLGHNPRTLWVRSSVQDCNENRVSFFKKKRRKKKGPTPMHGPLGLTLIMWYVCCKHECFLKHGCQDIDLQNINLVNYCIL